VPWYDPNNKVAKMLEAALARPLGAFGMSTNHVYHVRALLVAFGGL